MVSVTADVVQVTTPAGRIHNGVCSSYLSRLKEGDTAAIWVRKSTFRLPLDSRTPIILVGAASGLAPLMAFIKERKYQKMRGEQPIRFIFVLMGLLGVPVGDTLLFFGCFHNNTDFLYKDELLELHHDGIIELFTAFSHDQQKQIFAQHRMLEN